MLLLRPRINLTGNSTDQLANACLSLWTSNMAAEVLGDNNVCGELRPGGGNLNVLLFEYALAALVADRRGARLPCNFVIGVNTSGGPTSWPGESLDTLAIKAQRCKWKCCWFLPSADLRACLRCVHQTGHGSLPLLARQRAPPSRLPNQRLGVRVFALFAVRRRIVCPQRRAVNP